MSIPLVVLAAGAGTRMGGGKLALEVAGRPVLAWSLALAGEPCHVVVRPGDAQVEHLARDAGATVVVAEHAAEGMGHSLAAGLAALPADAPGAIVALGDDPLALLALPAVRAAAAPDPNRPVAVRRANHTPHPVYLPRAVWAALEPGDRGLRNVLDADCTWLDLDLPEPLDLDEPADLPRLEVRLSGLEH